MTTPREDAIAARLTAWAECVQRLMKVAPTQAVVNETGARYSGGGHSTPPERKAIREAAATIVDGWLARDLRDLAATPAPLDVERLTEALYRVHSWDVYTAKREAHDIAREYDALSAESRPDPVTPEPER